jgi:hypothetical protein
LFCFPVLDDNPINLCVRILEMAWACQDNSGIDNSGITMQLTWGRAVGL